jgi:hypothetical protein
MDDTCNEDTDAIIDFYMKIASDEKATPSAREDARDRLRQFAGRESGTTVVGIELRLNHSRVRN